MSDTPPYTPPPSAPQLSHAFGVRPPHLFSCNSTTALFVDGVKTSRYQLRKLHLKRFQVTECPNHRQSDTQGRMETFVHGRSGAERPDS